jgi:hypothetical protein
MNAQTTKNSDIEVSVDFTQSSAPIKYRFIDDYTGEGWQSSPWLTEDVQCLSIDEVLGKIAQYLDEQ